MVSFQCDACCDVVKKPKLDNHRARCNASFTCIDCSTTFPNPAAYKSHTSCISEAQKYEKSLYKGNTNGQAENVSRSNGWAKQNGNSNGRQQTRYSRPMGTGPNDQPLGESKRTRAAYSPSAEQVPEPHLKEAPPAAPITVATEETGMIAPEANEEAPKKKGRKKTRRTPPPPGETKAERKKRKKARRAIKKVEKLKFKAEQKALKAKAAALKRIQDAAAAAAERELRNKSTGAGDEKKPENDMPKVADLVLGDEGKGEVKKKKSKKPKPATNANAEDAMEVDVIPGVTATNEDANVPEEETGVEKKKSKKSKKSKVVAEADADSIPAVMVTANEGDAMGEDIKSEKKSKKRKRDEEDEGEGGKENGEQGQGGETLSFQEKSRAAKKARKAEKAAKKAAREGVSVAS